MVTISEYIISIDMGTTNTYVSMHNKPINTDLETFPSIIYFEKDGTIAIGHEARGTARGDANREVRAIKQQLGNPDYIFTIDGKAFRAPEIMTLFLNTIKMYIQYDHYSSLDSVTLIYPCYFSDLQITAMKEAGRNSGFRYVYTINKATATVWGYGFKPEGPSRKFLVFHCGGATCEASIIESYVDNKFHVSDFRVIANCYHSRFSGKDFDQRIVDWIAAEFKNEYGLDLRNDKFALIRLYETAESAKIKLSGENQSEINLPFISLINGEPKHIEDLILTRGKFDETTTDLVESATQLISNLLKDTGLKPEMIDEILLTGETTRIPAIQTKIGQIMGKEPLPSKSAVASTGGLVELYRNYPIADWLLHYGWMYKD